MNVTIAKCTPCVSCTPTRLLLQSPWPGAFEDCAGSVARAPDMDEAWRMTPPVAPGQAVCMLERCRRAPSADHRGSSGLPTRTAPAFPSRS